MALHMAAAKDVKIFQMILDFHNSMDINAQDKVL
jgi:hypothetical protein